MKSFQTILAGGMAALLAASVGCQPPDRSAGGNGPTSAGAGGFGGAIPGTASGPNPSGPITVGQVGSGPDASGQVGSGPGPDGGSDAGVPTTGSGGGSCGADGDCDDSDLCTEDTCVNSKCVQTPIVDDGDACTKDSCTPEVGPVHILDTNCCPHSVCTPGVALHPACIFLGAQQEVNCAPKVCASNQDPSCCSEAWDASCVERAQALCVSVTANPITCACEHSYCKAGTPLKANCDPCVAAVCSYAPSCCNTTWDSNCITQAHQYCNIPLGANCQ